MVEIVAERLEASQSSELESHIWRLFATARAPNGPPVPPRALWPYLVRMTVPSVRRARSLTGGSACRPERPWGGNRARCAADCVRQHIASCNRVVRSLRPRDRGARCWDARVVRLSRSQYEIAGLCALVPLLSDARTTAASPASVRRSGEDNSPEPSRQLPYRRRRSSAAVCNCQTACRIRTLLGQRALLDHPATECLVARSRRGRTRSVASRPSPEMSLRHASVAAA